VWIAGESWNTASTFWREGLPDQLVDLMGCFCEKLYIKGT
jgi:hypothetical protein